MNVWISYTTLNIAAPEVATVLSLFGNDGVYAWLEDERRTDGLVLYGITPIATAQAWLQEWPVGRLFNELADLRWERQAEDMIHLVMISAASLPDVFYAHKLDLKPLTDTPEYVLLWGEWRSRTGDAEAGKTWEEGRIPEVGRFYPAEWKRATRTEPYAAIVTQRYEVDWPIALSVRVVTRYLYYKMAYAPGFDPRCTERKET